MGDGNKMGHGHDNRLAAVEVNAPSRGPIAHDGGFQLKQAR
jgi:hypothetical protein